MHPKRADNINLKTQIRFGDRDLIVLTKEKWSDDPYKIVDLETFMAGNNLPQFDMTLRWRAQEDRSPRRRVMSSERPAGGEKEPMEQVQGQLIRQHSRQNTNNDYNSRKKLRRDVQSQNVELPASRDEEINTTQ